MADLIERKAVLETFAEMIDTPDYDVIARCYSEADVQKAVQALKDIPSANRWIPCSERLPEENCRVLISTEYKTTCIAYYSKEQWHPDGYKGAIFKPIYVLAWMPMPDAYEPPEVKADE